MNCGARTSKKATGLSWLPHAVAWTPVAASSWRSARPKQQRVCMRHARQGEEASQGCELSSSVDAVAHISLSPSRLSVLLKRGPQLAPDIRERAILRTWRMRASCYELLLTTTLRKPSDVLDQARNQGSQGCWGVGLVVRAGQKYPRRRRHQHAAVRDVCCVWSFGPHTPALSPSLCSAKTPRGHTLLQSIRRESCP